MTQPESAFVRTLRCVWGFGLSQEARKLQTPFLIWTFAWAIRARCTSKALVVQLFSHPAALAGVIILPCVFGLMAVHTYVRMLRCMDEMMQRIQLEGLAIGFGLTLMVIVGYSLFETYGATPIGSNNTILVFMLTWSFGQLLSNWRYR